MQDCNHGTTYAPSLKLQRIIVGSLTKGALAPLSAIVLLCTRTRSSVALICAEVFLSTVEEARPVLLHATPILVLTGFLCLSNSPVHPSRRAPVEDYPESGSNTGTNFPEALKASSPPVSMVRSRPDCGAHRSWPKKRTCCVDGTSAETMTMQEAKGVRPT